MKKLLILVLAVFVAGIDSRMGSARAADVDLLLVLAADVSRSVDDGEFALQRKGYAAAITNPRVLRAIEHGAHHTIAVSFIEFSGAGDDKVVLDWTAIGDPEQAAVAAATIRNAPRSFYGRTSISSAIDFALKRLAASKLSAARRMIDISGDGTSNGGPPLDKARAAAVAQGVTINGLAIINNSPSEQFSVHTHPPGGLASYYRDNVIGGPGAFLMVVDNFSAFSAAMAQKLATEIAARAPLRRYAASRP